jgi:hypothetical protein
MITQKSINIKEIFNKFQQIVSYSGKLKFFDEHFGLVPYNFPFLQTAVDILVRGEGINQLIEIFEEERKITLPLSKKLMYENEEFVFNIAPANSNRQLLNDYLIEYFLSNDNAYSGKLEEIKKLAATDKDIIKDALKDANDIISLIGSKLKNETERSFRNQFLTVFHNGYSDFKSIYVKSFSTKKKCIELYLYAQGILFAKHIEELEKAANYSGDENTENLPFDIPDNAKLKSKLTLLSENGIIEFLYGKLYTDEEIATFIMELLGEKKSSRTTIMNYLYLRKVKA